MRQIPLRNWTHVRYKCSRTQLTQSQNCCCCCSPVLYCSDWWFSTKKAKAKGGGGGGTRVGPKFLGLRVSPGAVSSSSSSQYWLDCVTVVVAKARTNRIIQSLQVHYTALNALYYSRKPTTDLRHDIDKILSHARTHTQTNKLQYNTTQYNTTQ